MTAEANKQIVRRYFERVVNQVDRVAAEQLVAPDLVFNSPYTPEPIRDRESFLQMLVAVHTAFPDFNLVDHQLIAEGDCVASRWTVFGTHQGALASFAPTGKPVAISGLSIYRVVDGKIVEGWVEDNTFQLLAMADESATAGTAAL